MELHLPKETQLNSFWQKRIKVKRGKERWLKKGVHWRILPLHADLNLWLCGRDLSLSSSYSLEPPPVPEAGSPGLREVQGIDHGQPGRLLGLAWG